MRTKMNSHEIYQYLLQRNFNLSSQKILKEPHLNSDTIWNIMVFLTAAIKDSRFEQIQPMLFASISPCFRQTTIRKIKDYIAVSQTLKKVLQNGEQYPIRQVVKPQKQWLMDRISMLIYANRHSQKVAKQYENIRTQIKLKSQFIQQQKRKYEMKNMEIEEVKCLKQKEKVQFQQKMQSIQLLNKQWNYKKKQKLDLINSQQQLDNELKKKIKALNQIQYSNEDLNIKIRQMQREVIRNAPRLKKQRFALLQQYQNIMRSNKNESDTWIKKTAAIKDKLKKFTDVKQKIKLKKLQSKLQQLRHVINELQQTKNIVAESLLNKNEYFSSKKDVLKVIQNLQKSKKQLNQSINGEQKQLQLLITSQKLLQDEQRQHLFNVKNLNQKNALSLAQYKILQEKIKHAAEKFKQKYFQNSLKLKNLGQESTQIIDQSFSDFY